MKLKLTLLLIIALLTLNFPPIALGAATPAHIQSVWCQDGGANATSKTCNITPTPGNTLIVHCYSNASDGGYSVTDNKGNSYTTDVSAARTGVSSALARASNISGTGAYTLTCSKTGTVGFMNVMIAEYSGLDNASPVDLVKSGSGTSANPTTSGTTVTANPTDLVVGAFAENNGTNLTLTAGSGYTLRQGSGNGTAIFVGGLEDRNVTSTGNYQGNFTYSDASGVWSALMVAYKASGSTPPPADTTPPSIPTNLSATAISSSQINLAWTASTDDTAVTGYKIYRNGSLLTTVSSPLTTFSDTGLSPSTSYSYTVSAYDAANNNSNQSTSASATTQSPPVVLPALIVSSVSAAAGTNVDLPVTLTSSTAGVSGLQFDLTLPSALTHVSTAAGSSSTAAGKQAVTNIVGGNLRVLIFGFNTTVINPGEVAVVKLNIATGTAAGLLSIPISGVIFTDAGGLVIPGGTNTNGSVTVTPPPDTIAPSVPTNLSATAISSSAINLSWTASTDAVGVTGYKIFRGGVQIGTSATNSYSDTGLNPSTLYSYTVSAYDAANNNSNQSSSASATTQAVQSGSTITAASCNAIDVQNAINSVSVDNATVIIPAGTCTWTGAVSATLTRSLTIQGAGAISSADAGSNTTGSDITTILDHHPSSGHSIFNFSVSSGKRVRITGIKIMMDSSSVTTQNGVISISGGSNSVRIDHNHFVINPDSSMTIGVYGGVTGVIDHNYFDSEVGNGPFGVYLQNGTGTGDAAWNSPDDFGTDKFIFIEDNRWRNGYLGDANTGGQRFVYRYNTAVIQANDSVPTVGYVANHGLTSGRNRSTRAFEYYGNNFSALAPGLNKSPFPVNGGTGLVWGNTISQYRYVTSLNYTRKDNATYPYGSPPSGWGNCTGTSGTVWDGNGGYPCLDQPGRGMGDLLSGSFPNIINTRTGNAAYVQQALSPVYVWANTLNPAGYSPTPIVATDGPVQANRDFYQQFGANGESGSFDGTRGVGEGLFSARPATCTAGPGGNTPGVGYWATNQNTLYVCNSTNNWTAYYTPYTYPHPLQNASAGGGDTTAPSVPTGLSATAVSTSAINLSWIASTDAVGVTGYKIFRNGTQVGTSATNSYSDTGLIASTNYSYTVSAYDAAGNTSSQSTSASATTQSGTPIAGDLNLDHIVNALDYSLLNSKWLQNFSAYDLFADGLINSLDFAILSSNWGKTW